MCILEIEINCPKYVCSYKMTPNHVHVWISFNCYFSGQPTYLNIIVRLFIIDRNLHFNKLDPSNLNLKTHSKMYWTLEHWVKTLQVHFSLKYSHTIKIIYQLNCSHKVTEFNCIKGIPYIPMGDTNMVDSTTPYPPSDGDCKIGNFILKHFCYMSFFPHLMQILS